MMDYSNLDEGGTQAVDVPRVLNVIRYAGAVSLAVGTGSIVCGVLTLIYANPMIAYPFTTGSGIWAGAIVLSMGLLAIYFTHIHGSNSAYSAMKWVNGYRMFGHLSATVGGLHLGYSVACLITCTTRSKNDDGVEICNTTHHASLLTLQAFGIAFGAMIICLGLFGIIYVLSGGRGATLTANPNYGKCGQCYSM